MFPRKSRVRLAFRIGVAVLLLGLFAAAALVWYGLRDENGPADAGLVLGNTVQLDGKPSARLSARLKKALELYRAGVFPRILVSGGLGPEGWEEAEVMRDYLKEGGVPESAIVVDREGWTTWASAVKTRDYLQAHQLKSVLVVSQYFHVPRARLALRRVGVPVVYGAHAPFFELRDLYSIPRELAGLVKYTLRRQDSAVP